MILMEGREALGADAGMVALPTADDGELELVATFGFTPEELAGWERIDCRSARPSATRTHWACRSCSRTASASVRFPDSGGQGCSDGVGSAAHGRAADRRARLPVRARPPVQPGRPRAGLEPRRPLRAGAGARAPVRRRASFARGAGPAGDASASASPGRSTPTTRCARSPRSSCPRSPTSASSISSTTARSAGWSPPTPTRTLQEARPDAGGIRPRPGQRHAGRRCDPHLDHRSSCRSRRSCPSRPTAARRTAPPWSRSAFARCCRRRSSCAVRTIGRADVRLAPRPRVRRARDRPRQADRAPGRARARQRAPLRRAARHRAHAAAEPAARHAPAAAGHRDRPRGTGRAARGREVGGDFYDAWPLARRRLRDRDRRRRRQGSGRGRADGADPPRDEGRGALRESPSRILEVVNETILGRAQRGRVLHRRAGAAAPATTTATRSRAPAPGTRRRWSCARRPAPSRRPARGARCSAPCPIAKFHDATTHLADGDVVRLLDGRRHRAPHRRRAVRRGAPHRARRLAGRLDGRGDRREPSTTPSSRSRRGLPDDDVAILTLRLVGRRGRPLADRAGAPRGPGRRRAKAATLRAMATTRDIERGGLAWREAGSGAPAAIFLHGLGGSRTAWDDQLRELSDRRRCVAWDLPGYGAAPPPAGDMTFAALADTVARLADAIEPEDRPHLIGLSLGGMIAQHAALAHRGRFRSLTLLGSSPAFGLDGTTAADWRAARLAPLDAGQEPADFADAVLRSIAGPGISEQALAAPARGDGAHHRRRPAAPIDCLVDHDLRDRLAEIDLPTLGAGRRARHRDAAVLRGRDRGAPSPARSWSRSRAPATCSAPRRPTVVNELLRDHFSRRGARMTEHRWLHVFGEHLARCALRPGEVVAVLSESASRPCWSRRSGSRPSCRAASVVDVVVPTPREPASRADPVDRRLAGDRGQPGRDRRARGRRPGARLHRRGPAARARARRRSSPAARAC